MYHIYRHSFVSLAVMAIAALSGAAQASPAEVRIVATEFKYAPSEVRVKAGAPVTLVLDNSQAATEHGLAVPVLKFRVDARAGQVARKTFTFDKPGTYPIVCNLPGHTEAGMTGTLVVQK
jgi:cytochrome c oxidase subunit 2